MICTSQVCKVFFRVCLLILRSDSTYHQLIRSNGASGESYAGQYVPNIAHFILNNEPFTSRINLKGIALGNACWGGNATLVVSSVRPLLLLLLLALAHFV